MQRSEQTRGKSPDPWDIGFGVVVLVSALLALFIWFPVDIKGGFFNTTPLGKLEPGDAFFPILLACALVVLAVLQLLSALLGGSSAGDTRAKLTAHNFRFLAIFLLICVVGLGIMFTLGPATVWVMRELGWTDAQYRHLTDTAPYKYIGYVAGGSLMTLTLIGWTEGRLRRTAVVTVLAVLLVAIGVFDGLLNNVLLPPNAEY